MHDDRQTSPTTVYGTRLQGKIPNVRFPKYHTSRNLQSQREHNKDSNYPMAFTFIRIVPENDEGEDFRVDQCFLASLKVTETFSPLTKTMARKIS